MKRRIPSMIHVLNLAGLFVGSVIVVLAGVTRSYQLVILGPLLLLMLGYWHWRDSRQVARVTRLVALTVLVWVVFCESTVVIDDHLQTRFTRRLELGMRLQSYVSTRLPAGDNGNNYYYQAHTSDPLLYHYRPGSLHKAGFDCETCNAPEQAVVDETGYLNRAQGLWSRQAQIELFVAGDSVLQGLGVPSVMEHLRDQLPMTLWNLSVAGYGPRQTVSALLAYALPKHPKWLVVVFNANNDASDEIQNNLCDDAHNFHCYFGVPDTRNRLVKHPVYRHLIANTDDLFETFAHTAAQNLTLARTRLLIDSLKGALKSGVNLGPPAGSPTSAIAGGVGRDHAATLPLLPSPPGGIQFRPGHRMVWTSLGMALTHTAYERLAGKLAAMADKPTVILLYNPSPYELYRDILVASDPESDQVAAFQRDVQRAFAASHTWRFVDLTDPLRVRLQDGPIWLYGRYDRSHWSPQGTALVAPVLRASLLGAIGQ